VGGEALIAKHLLIRLGLLHLEFVSESQNDEEKECSANEALKPPNPDDACGDIWNELLVGDRPKVRFAAVASIAGR
jgi:hypothetical protein